MIIHVHHEVFQVFLPLHRLRSLGVGEVLFITSVAGNHKVLNKIQKKITRLKLGEEDEEEQESRETYIWAIVRRKLYAKFY